MQTYLHSFSSHYLYQHKKLIWIVRYCLWIVLLVLVSATGSFAEGTKQLEPGEANSTFRLKIVLNNEGDGGSGWRIPFALPNCDTNYRLNVYIKDFTTEKIYFGFNDDGAGLFYQLREPNGALVGNPVYSPYQAFPTSGAG